MFIFNSEIYASYLLVIFTISIFFLEVKVLDIIASLHSLPQTLHEPNWPSQINHENINKLRAPKITDTCIFIIFDEIYLVFASRLEKVNILRVYNLHYDLPLIFVSIGVSTASKLVAVMKNYSIQWRWMSNTDQWFVNLSANNNRQMGVLFSKYQHQHDW